MVCFFVIARSKATKQSRSKESKHWIASLPLVTRNDGFTLIELSIVLVIIGLIVGGILVGQDLVRAAEVRAQVSQIEKFNSAISTDLNSILVSNAAIPVIQAYNMDKKMDDGLPTVGAVQATYVNGTCCGADAARITLAPNAATDSAATCYNTTNNVYSIGSFADYGSHGSCAISFRFQ